MPLFVGGGVAVGGWLGDETAGGGVPPLVAELAGDAAGGTPGADGGLTTGATGLLDMFSYWGFCSEELESSLEAPVFLSSPPDLSSLPSLSAEASSGLSGLSPRSTGCSTCLVSAGSVGGAGEGGVGAPALARSSLSALIFSICSSTISL